jgi:hypothetical protein
MFGVIRGLYRGARRQPLTSKRGHNYYKGMSSINAFSDCYSGCYELDFNQNSG